MKPFDPWSVLPLAGEILLFVAAMGGGTWAWIRIRQAQSWPSTQGTISGTSVLRKGDRNFRPWVAELVYAYVVGGEYFSGYYRMRARSERRAEEMISGWKNRMVVVRYSPNKPEVSILLSSDQPGGQSGNQP